MRIFTKVMKIFFIVFTVLSFCLSLFIGFSTSFKLALKDNLSVRQRIYLNTEGYLSDAKNKNVFNFNYTYYEDDSTFVDEKMGCYKTKKGAECSWIQKVYSINEKGKKTLTKTSFTKGDGFLYSTDGTNKEKSIYSGDSLETMSDNLFDIFKDTSAYICDFTDEDQNRYAEYNTSIDFHFNTFKMDKKIKYVAIDNYIKRKSTFTVDHKDRIIKIETLDKKTIEINYDNTRIRLPSIDGYIAA